MSFSFDQLSTPMIQAISDLGYTEPTEIQIKTIPVLLNGNKNFVGKAQTGTGKTAAFAIPMLEKHNPDLDRIQVLILAPTRELACQIHQEIQKFSRYMNFQSATVYGGVGYKEQIDNLKKSHIVIATPGRAIDLFNKGTMNLESCQLLIIDEADEMLKMGFIDDVEILMDAVSKQSNTWMFSATMPPKVVKLIDQKIKSPVMVQIKNKTASNENIAQSYCTLPHRDFIKALQAVLMSEPDFYGIVFCETREETKRVTEKLISLQKRVVSLHGDLNQNQRDAAIEQFKNRRASVLVCTDVAARGLDVSEVTHVINMGLPRKHDSYIHRVGRTGRAGNTGKAISFVAPSDIYNLRNLEKVLNKRLMPLDLPSVTDLKMKKVSGELSKMEGIQSALSEKGEAFVVDYNF